MEWLLLFSPGTFELCTLTECITQSHQDSHFQQNTTTVYIGIYEQGPLVNIHTMYLKYCTWYYLKGQVFLVIGNLK